MTPRLAIRPKRRRAPPPARRRRRAQTRPRREYIARRALRSRRSSRQPLASSGHRVAVMPAFFPLGGPVARRASQRRTPSPPPRDTQTAHSGGAFGRQDLGGRRSVEAEAPLGVVAEERHRRGARCRGDARVPHGGDAVARCDDQVAVRGEREPAGPRRFAVCVAARAPAPLGAEAGRQVRTRARRPRQSSRPSRGPPNRRATARVSARIPVRAARNTAGGGAVTLRHTAAKPRRKTRSREQRHARLDRPARQPSTDSRSPSGNRLHGRMSRKRTTDCAVQAHAIERRVSCSIAARRRSRRRVGAGHPVCVSSSQVDATATDAARLHRRACRRPAVSHRGGVAGRSPARQRGHATDPAGWAAVGDAFGSSRSPSPPWNQSFRQSRRRARRR